MNKLQAMTYLVGGLITEAARITGHLMYIQTGQTDEKTGFECLVVPSLRKLEGDIQRIYEQMRG